MLTLLTLHYTLLTLIAKGPLSIVPLHIMWMYSSTGCSKKTHFRNFQGMLEDQIFWLFLVVLSKYHCNCHIRPFLVFLVILAHFFGHFKNTPLDHIWSSQICQICIFGPKMVKWGVHEKILQNAVQICWS